MNFPARKKFEEWLRTQPAETLVGECCSLGRCPLAKFLEFRGAPNPYVRPDQTALNSCWRPSDGGPRRPLPQWANNFAREVDLYRHSGWIEAGRCLEILSFI